MMEANVHEREITTTSAVTWMLWVWKEAFVNAAIDEIEGVEVRSFYNELNFIDWRGVRKHERNFTCIHKTLSGVKVN